MCMRGGTARRPNSGSTHSFCTDSKGFKEAELRRLWSMIEERKQEFLKAWHDYFDG